MTVFTAGLTTCHACLKRDVGLAVRVLGLCVALASCGRGPEPQAVDHGADDARHRPGTALTSVSDAPLKIVDPQRMKPFVPDALSGLPRMKLKLSAAEPGGVPASAIDAEFERGNEKISLRFDHAQSFVALRAQRLRTSANGITVNDEDGYMGSYVKDGRIVDEIISKVLSHYNVTLANGLLVSSYSATVDLKSLKGAVEALPLAELEKLR